MHCLCTLICLLRAGQVCISVRLQSKHWKVGTFKSFSSNTNIWIKSKASKFIYLFKQNSLLHSKIWQWYLIHFVVWLNLWKKWYPINMWHFCFTRSLLLDTWIEILMFVLNVQSKMVFRLLNATFFLVGGGGDGKGVFNTYALTDLGILLWQ